MSVFSVRRVISGMGIVPPSVRRAGVLLREQRRVALSADESRRRTGVPGRRWSTIQAPKSAQFTQWRELICEAFLDLTPEADAPDGFVGQVIQFTFGDPGGTHRPMGELAVAHIRSEAQRVRRTPKDIARAPRCGYYANLQVRGSSVMTQGERSARLHAGDLAIVDTTQPFTFGFQGDFQQLAFHIPAELLNGQTEQALPTATRIRTTTGVGAALRHALQMLGRNELPAEAALRLAVHTTGMLAVALEQPGEAHAVAGRRSRTYAAALADIEEHIGDHDLSPAATARRMGISVRQLHSLFAGQEYSYASEVRGRRLEIARRDLADPARAHLRIIDIAVEAGFVNVASFHRAFRRRFGQTPARVRAAALGASPDRC